MYLRHPLSAAFFSMNAIDQDKLTDDIEKNGQLDPITIYDGQILDGWHRYQSCQMLGREPFTVDLPSDVDPVAFVISKNNRKHLSASQIAAGIVICHEWAKSGDNQHTERGGEIVSPPTATVPEMAKQGGVSERIIQQAKRAAEAGIINKVVSGELTASKAAEIAKPPKVAAPLPPVVEDDPEPEQPQPEMVTIEKEMLESMQQLIDMSHAENVELEKMCDGDDKMLEAVETIKRMTAQIAGYKSRLEGEQAKNNELIKTIKSKDYRIAKLEKEIESLKMEILPL